MNVKVIFAAASALLFSLLSLVAVFLLSIMGLALPKLFDFGYLQSLMGLQILPLLVACALIGVASGLLFSALKELDKPIAGGAAFMASFAAVAAGTVLFLGQAMDYLALGLAFSISMAVAAALVSGTGKERGVRTFNFGFGAAKKAFTAFAILSFIVVFALGTLGQAPYEDALKGSMKEVIRQSSDLGMTREQIGAMVDAQGSGSDVARGIAEGQDYTMGRSQIEAMYAPVYEDLGMELTEERVDSLYIELNTPALLEERKQRALASLESQPQMDRDALVEQLYTTMNSPEKKEGMMKAADEMVESMPMLQGLYAWVGLLAAFAFASMVMLLQSFVLAPFAALGSALGFFAIGMLERGVPGKSDAIRLASEE